MGSSAINSKYYVLGISDRRIYSDIYKIFYNILSKEFEPTNNRFWYSAFPDIEISDSSEYPLGVINSADIVFNKSTQTKNEIEVYLEIETYTTKKSLSDDYASEILYQLNSNIHYLRSFGIKNFKLEDDEYNMLMRDKIKLHNKSQKFYFTLVRDKVSLSW